MAGILSVFNDIAPEGYDHFERWYNREHLQERVNVPGFRFGRRYELVSGGDRRFFAFYEVDSPDVLSSPVYVQRLENPTAWTRESMKYFRHMVRTVCDLRAAAGDLVGSHAVVLRADEKMAPAADAGGLVERLAAEPGVARVQLWTAAARQTPSDTAEMKARGPGSARRRRLGGRVRAPRRCGPGRRHARQAAGPRSASRARRRSASMGCCVPIRIRRACRAPFEARAGREARRLRRASAMTQRTGGVPGARGGASARSLDAPYDCNRQRRPELVEGRVKGTVAAAWFDQAHHEEDPPR